MDSSCFLQLLNCSLHFVPLGRISKKSSWTDAQDETVREVLLQVAARTQDYWEVEFRETLALAVKCQTLSQSRLCFVAQTF